MEDIIKSIKATLYDRVVSPLFGTFVISWSAWNYKFLLLIFSSKDYELKIKLIDILYIDHLHIFLFGFLFPAITTYLYIWWISRIAEFVYRRERDNQRRLKKIKQEIEDEMPLTIEEARKLRADIKDVAFEADKKIREYEELINEYKKENGDLKENNSKQQSEISKLEKEVEELSTEKNSERIIGNKKKSAPEIMSEEIIEDDGIQKEEDSKSPSYETEISILDLLADSPENGDYRSNIISKIDSSKVLILHSLSELSRKEDVYYDRDISDENDVYFRISNKGIKRLVDTGRY